MKIRLLGLLIVLLIPAVAQSEPPAKKDEQAIQVRLLAEHAPDNLDNVLMRFSNNTQSSGIVLPTNQLSNPILCTSRQMLLQTEEKGIPLCQITLPDQGKTFAVVLVTAKPSGYSPIIVRTDDPDFGAGDFYFINRSDQTVLGKLGETPLVLQTGSSAKSRPSQPVDNAYYNIAFAIREPSGDRLIRSTRWPIGNHSRSYIFFFNDRDGNVTFRAVDEFLPPQP
jgi:hypothetical protein